MPDWINSRHEQKCHAMAWLRLLHAACCMLHQPDEESAEQIGAVRLRQAA
jgi:hypothetical protein